VVENSFGRVKIVRLFLSAAGKLSPAKNFFPQEMIDHLGSVLEF
jgi:hypothetical protein